jgi:hypothetical protein
VAADHLGFAGARLTRLLDAETEASQSGSAVGAAAALGAACKRERNKGASTITAQVEPAAVPGPVQVEPFAWAGQEHIGEASAFPKATVAFLHHQLGLGHVLTLVHNVKLVAFALVASADEHIDVGWRSGRAFHCGKTLHLRQDSVHIAGARSRHSLLACA